MSTRAKRRQDGAVIAKLATQASATELDTIAELAAARGTIDTLKAYCKTYKTRLERCAMGFQFVSNAIIANKIPEAQVAMRAMMANDLKEARETVGNRAMALDIAVRAIENRYVKGQLPFEFQEALDRIKVLAPEAFGGEVAPTAPAVSGVPS